MWYRSKWYTRSIATGKMLVGMGANKHFVLRDCIASALLDDCILSQRS